MTNWEKLILKIVLVFILITSYKNLIGFQSLGIRFNINKIDGFVRVYDGTRNLVLKNMIQFTTGLDVL